MSSPKAALIAKRRELRRPIRLKQNDLRVTFEQTKIGPPPFSANRQQVHYRSNYLRGAKKNAQKICGPTWTHKRSHNRGQQ